jgi:hypothetical protein
MVAGSGACDRSLLISAYKFFKNLVPMSKGSTLEVDIIPAAGTDRPTPIERLI